MAEMPRGKEAGILEKGAETTGAAAPDPQARLITLREESGATWDGPDDPHDPYNWPSTRKISIAMITSFGQLVTLMSTSMMAAALTQIASDLGMGVSTMQVAFSISVLGMAFGPFLIAPLSEMYGRKPVWLLANAWYMLWNSLCPVGNSQALMIVGRLMAGLGASVGITLTGPIMADMYRAEHRGKSLAMAAFVPYLGPALGPILGGLVTQHINWPWLFWILSMFDAVVTLLGIIILIECYTPVLLRRKTAAQHQVQRALTDRVCQEVLSQLRINLQRPLLLLIKRPIILVITLLLALSFGNYCLMLSTYATLWIDRYHESETISSLNYIAIAIGTTLAAQGGGSLMDFIWRYLRKRAGGNVTPEYRVPLMVPGVVLMSTGLFWYGWSAEKQISWVVVDFGAGIFTCGSFLISQAMLAYLLDEFQHAASANAAARMLSNILGFAFPIFAPQMYDCLGYGWGNSLLAFIFMAFGVPAPIILWIWGAKLRALGRES